MKINSKEVDQLCSVLRKQGPVSRRMVGRNILISVRTKSADAPVPVYFIDTLDHVRRVSGLMNLGRMVANLAELVGPRFIARETTFAPVAPAMAFGMSAPTPAKTSPQLRPKRKIGPRLITGPLDVRQREMKERNGVAL